MTLSPYKREKGGASRIFISISHFAFVATVAFTTGSDYEHPEADVNEKVTPSFYYIQTKTALT